jgi:2-hydroxy-6-oxonona-2,4-dienedioate hydrolase
MSKSILRWFGVASLATAAYVTALYWRDMGRAYQRIAGRSALIPSPFGDIEYSQGGAGTPVLVIHGSGGGFDQGELMARALLGERLRWIAPSRFGYLRSTFHPGATFDDQANAYAHLLDRLGVKKVAVVTLSHGGPSALLFAVLHPERVSSLTLISAGVAASSKQGQAAANERGDRLMTIFKHDVLYWGISKLLRGTLMELMGATEAVIAGMTPKQRTLVDEIIDTMNPVAPRAAGAAFDNGAAMPNQRISAIRTPTLILHAVDDTLQLFHNAEFAAATIPDARLVRFDRGGHLLLSVEHSKVRELTQQHILDHADN